MSGFILRELHGHHVGWFKGGVDKSKELPWGSLPPNTYHTALQLPHDLFGLPFWLWTWWMAYTMLDELINWLILMAISGEKIPQPMQSHWDLQCSCHSLLPTFILFPRLPKEGSIFSHPWTQRTPRKKHSPQVWHTMALNTCLPISCIDYHTE